MGEIYFTVEGTPRPYATKVGRQGQIFYRPLCRAWQKTVIEQVEEQLPEDWVLITEQCEAEYHFYLPRPKAHWGTGKNAHVLKDSAPQKHAITPDSSKLTRITEDALTHAGVWEDDALCSPVITRKSWTTKPDNEGGAVILVRW